MRAWISPEITYEEFVAMDVPAGWRKNQPRTGSDSSGQGGATSRFLRSPDAEVEGDLLIEEHFGFRWFHAATIVEIGVPIDPTGLLFAARVRKFHEIVFERGSRIVILQSPEGDLYFRIGRDAERTEDEPEIPEGWRLLEATTPGSFVILLAPENLVIRTRNQDSFQGPVPDLSSLL